MKTNTRNFGKVRTHEGALVPKSSALKELRRAVMAHMLFEDNFYEDGKAISVRMSELLKQVSFKDAAQIAVDAREKFKLRHVPLFIVRELLRDKKNGGRQMGDLIYTVIQRPDECAELLALYWKDKADQPLTAQLKQGLARALRKFNQYQLAKWNKDAAIKLRDVLFLTHAKPKDSKQEIVFKQLAENTLPIPDTWEVALSGGADKKTTFSRLLEERKLGGLALLRNLRNMRESGVNEDLIRVALRDMNTERILPFRFISAAKYAPNLEDALEGAMFKSLAEMPKLSGKTAILVDHSGSMNVPVSARSDITRFEAANGVAMLARDICEQARIFQFSTITTELPNRRGFALADAVRQSKTTGGTDAKQAVEFVHKNFPDYDRLIMITDEQSRTLPPAPKSRGYVINVAGYQNSIAYGPWVSISGWSEAILDYIKEYEAEL